MKFSLKHSSDSTNLSRFRALSFTRKHRAGTGPEQFIAERATDILDGMEKEKHLRRTGLPFCFMVEKYQKDFTLTIYAEIDDASTLNTFNLSRFPKICVEGCSTQSAISTKQKLIVRRAMSILSKTLTLLQANQIIGLAGNAEKTAQSLCVLADHILLIVEMVTSSLLKRLTPINTVGVHV